MRYFYKVIQRQSIFYRNNIRW